MTAQIVILLLLGRPTGNRENTESVAERNGVQSAARRALALAQLTSVPEAGILETSTGLKREKAGLCTQTDTARLLFLRDFLGWSAKDRVNSFEPWLFFGSQYTARVKASE